MNFNQNPCVTNYFHSYASRRVANNPFLCSINNQAQAVHQEIHGRIPRNITIDGLQKVRKFLEQWIHANLQCQLQGCMYQCSARIARILQHIAECNKNDCRCVTVKKWMGHFASCCGNCFVCGPVYEAVFKPNYCKRKSPVLFDTETDVMHPTKFPRAEDGGELVDVVRRYVHQFQDTNEQSTVHNDQRRGNLYSGAEVPLDPQMSRFAPFSSQLTPEQVTEMNWMQTQGINQMEVYRVDAVDGSNPFYNSHDTNNYSQQDQVRSRPLNPATNVIVLDEDDQHNPFVVENFNVQYAQNFEKNFNHEPNGSNFLKSATPGSVLNTSVFDQSAQKETNAAVYADFSIDRIPFPSENAVELSNPSHENHDTHDYYPAIAPADEDEQTNEYLLEETRKENREAAQFEALVEEINSTVQCEQEVEKNLFSTMNLSPDAHVQKDTEVNQELVGSIDENLGKVYSMVNIVPSDEGMNENSFEEMSSIQFDQQVQSEEISNEDREAVQLETLFVEEDTIAQSEKVEKNLVSAITLPSDDHVQNGSDNQELAGSMIEDINPSDAAMKENFFEEKTSVQFDQKAEAEFDTKDDFKVSNILIPSSDPLNCASLIYYMTPGQIREHISALKPCSNQGETTIKDENNCSLCESGEIPFKIQPTFCKRCDARITPNTLCYRERNINSIYDGTYAYLYYCRKCKNKENLSGGDPTRIGHNEPWVSCNSCGRWLHQICTLFNEKKDESGQADHTCPECYLRAIQGVNHTKLGHNEILEAKNLPRTKLSDHIEQWLSRKLEEDRQKRAAKLGKNINEVPAAEDLVVREVSSVNEKAQVPDILHKMISKDNDYPKEFPYKSKALMLFQKIGGTDVCIFAAYTQEYGFECPEPNRGRVYLSYIDSVNHFRPRTQAANDEPLRTFVYQQILIAYLDYCKKRGFKNVHLWACPSPKHSDYIFNCHPKEQKMLTDKNLIKWYHNLVTKAKAENVVVDSTSFYHKYFLRAGNEELSNIVKKLPYFVGDHWPTKFVDFTKKGKSKKLNSISREVEALILEAKDNLIIINLQHETTGNFNMEDLHITNQDKVGMDEDENISSKVLNTALGFLTFCRENCFQFDTLRCAKYSTMMMLYYLDIEAKESAEVVDRIPNEGIS
ncbi:uncharacterized protein A4U43_C01F4070 [Asparagus officinalis]|uniref:histone acetyltransferase n=1 Tax=Asparagus officinalis TaxID=4686 RepID=A0A5P1FNB0_ASPOF|nr:probable histone acetyltransferase HAC-like 3 [Asparagus officinalis]ONK79213.1 uncharacterized protein A4U43_C01F4070 [Asparagus officinalis]